MHASVVVLVAHPQPFLVQYGASMVFSEEIIDRKVATCDRTVDEKTGLISYTYTDKKAKHFVPAPVFVTYPNEPVVFQMGSNSGPTALRAAQVYPGCVYAL